MATVYANPQQVKDPASTAEALAPLLKKPVGELLEKLNEDSGFKYLARKVEAAIGEEVKALDLDGVFVCTEDKRVYPTGALAPQLLGFVGTDNVGLAGLEKEYEELLAGDAGTLQVMSDQSGNRLSTTHLEEASPGDSITLTIDKDIQFEVEKVLSDVVEEFDAKKACAVFIDPDTGEILAMANTPVFDTNDYGSVDEKDRRNSVVTDQYEPGSTFKMVVAAAALEAGLVTPETKFTLGRTIQVYDVEVHEAHEDVAEVRELTVTDILAQSSNVGAVTLGLEVGKDRLVDMIEKFGFTKKLGIDFPGEASGRCCRRRSGRAPPSPTSPSGRASRPVLSNWRPPTRPSPTTACWCSRIWCAMSPHPWTRRVVSEKVAAQLRAMLAVTVEDGTGTKAQMSGYQVAGKTGTAQKVNEEEGGYADDRFVASFVGMVPADEPRLVILVMVDEPSDGAPGCPRGGSRLREDRRSLSAPGHSAQRRFRGSGC